MIEHNFTRCKSDPCIYYKKLPNGKFFILLLYVDVMLVAEASPKIVAGLKTKFASTFSMKDLGATKKILGMTITRDRKKRMITFSQNDYINKVIERFGIVDAHSISTPLATHF